MSTSDGKALDQAPDETVPSPARLYDYWLGGSHNFPVDREVGEQIAGRWPAIAAIARANRAFARNAVRALRRRGIRQFVDIGGGIPTLGGLHALAQATDPTVTMVSVDIDPVASYYAAREIADNPHAGVIRADARDVDALFDHEVIGRLIDPHQPVGVIMAAMLHLVPDADDPAGIVAGLRERVAPGSWLGISHLTEDFLGPAAAREAESMYRASSPVRFRTRAEIERLFDGWAIQTPPGLDWINHWATPPEEAPMAEGSPESRLMLAGLATKTG